MKTSNQNSESDKSHFLNLFSLAISDSKVSIQEIELLYKIGIENGMDKDKIDYLIENPHKVKFIKPETLDEMITQLYDFCRMIISDEKVDVRETILYRSLTSQFGISGDKSMLLLDLFLEGIKSGTNKDVLFQEAKDNLTI